MAAEAMLTSPSIKHQLKAAAEKKCEIALIIGQKEALDETVILRDMRSGMQEVFALERIIEEVKKRLGK
jgi:histidyl-tRNA synthetase